MIKVPTKEYLSTFLSGYTGSVNGMYITQIATTTKTKITITLPNSHTGCLMFGDYNTTVSAFVFAYVNGTKLTGNGSIAVSSGTVTITANTWCYYTVLSNDPITYSVS